MSDYKKQTNFASKDSLPKGDPDKVVKGSEIDTEFNSIESSNNTKLDQSSNLSDVDDVSTSQNNLNVYDRSKFSDQSLDVDFNSVAQNGTNVALTPGSSSDPGLAFDTDRTPNSNRPTLVTVHATTKTDGATYAQVDVKVDESGDDALNSSDYTMAISKCDPNEANDAGTASFIIPTGGAYRIDNQSDPDGSNDILANREFTM